MKHFVLNACISMLSWRLSWWCLLLVPLEVAAEKIRLQLKWHHAFQFAGYYAAQQQGYYKDAGLDVEIVPATPNMNVVTEVCSGRAQFGIGTSSLLVAYSQGQPVRLVANVYQHSAFVLLSRQLNKLQDIHDLRGQRLMLEQGSDELKAYLLLQGIGPADYQLIPHSFDIGDLVAGRIDAMSAYSIEEPVLLEQANIPFHAYTPRASGIDFYGDNLFTCAEFAEQKPQLVQAFRKASMQGWVYAMSHVDSVIHYMITQKLTQADELMLQAQAKALAPLLRFDLIEPGYINRARWQHIAEVYQQLGVIDQIPALEPFLPLPPKPINPLWFLFAAIACVVLFTSFVVLGYITRVNRRLSQLLTQKRAQKAWQKVRSECLQLMLQQHHDKLDVLRQVLVLIAEHRPSLQLVLILDRVNSVPDLLSVQLTANGVADLQQRLAGFHDDCDMPGLNLLRVPSLGSPIPEFTHSLIATAAFCAFPLQSEQKYIPGVLLCWQAKPFSATHYELLDELVTLLAVGLERFAASEALKHSEARHRLLTDHASDVIWTLDPQGKISYISPAVERLRGYSPKEVMHQHISQAMTPASAEKIQAALQQGLTAVAQGLPYPEFVAEIEQPHKAGGTVWVEVKTAGIYDEQQQFIGIVGITRDLTERKQAELQMAHLAQHDSLTGLPNRLLFHDRLEQALHYCSRHQRQLAVLLLDLNKFKPVNDQYGHAAGDELLVQIGQRLRGLLRASDTLARIGGDEFVVLIPQLDVPHEADLVAEKIRGCLREPFLLSMAQVQIGCSIGVALFPEDGSDEDSLLQVADTRMYAQKQAERQSR